MDEFGLEANVLERIREVLASYPIERAFIIGSRARGNYSRGSDIDIVIFAPKLSFSQYLRLMSDLDELNLPYKIDLIRYESLKDEDFLRHIREEGKEFYRVV